MDFQVAALLHLERHAPDLHVPRIIASRTEPRVARRGGRQSPHGAAAQLDSRRAALARRAADTPRTSERRGVSGKARTRTAGFFPPARPSLCGLGHPTRAPAGGRRTGGVAEDAKALCAELNARLQREVLPVARAARASRARQWARRQPAAHGSRRRRDRRRNRLGDMVHAPLVQDLAVTLASFARHGEMSLDNAVAQVESWNAVLPSWTTSSKSCTT